MNEDLAFDWVTLAAPAAAAAFCFIAALTLLSLMRINKGAKLNRAYGSIAFGLVCFGLIGIDRALDLLGLPNASVAEDVLMASGATFILIGAVYGRSLYRKLAK